MLARRRPLAGDPSRPEQLPTGPSKPGRPPDPGGHRLVQADGRERQGNLRIRRTGPAGRAGLPGRRCDPRRPHPQRLASVQPPGSGLGPVVPQRADRSRRCRCTRWRGRRLGTAGFVAAGGLRTRAGRTGLAAERGVGGGPDRSRPGGRPGGRRARGRPRRRARRRVPQPHGPRDGAAPEQPDHPPAGGEPRAPAAAPLRHDARRLLRGDGSPQPARRVAPGRPPPRRQGAGAGAGARRGVDHGQQGAAGRGAHGPPRRAGLGVRGGQLPALAEGHLARPHRRREAGAGLGEGAHRRVRRRPRLRGHHRRLGRRAPVVARRAHPERRRLPARVRGRRHDRAGGGALLRRLRLHQP